MMLYLRLFAEFFCTGLFSVGGGLATIPFLQDMGQRTGWFTSHDLANMIAISESTPGPMGVNMATYVGFTSAGIPGSAIATLGLITPSIIVIIIVATVLRRFRDSKYVRRSLLRPPPRLHRPHRRSGLECHLHLPAGPPRLAGGRPAAHPAQLALSAGGGGSPGAHPDQAHQKIASRPLDSPLRRGRRPVPALSTAVTKQQSVQFLYRS